MWRFGSLPWVRWWVLSIKAMVCTLPLTIIVDNQLVSTSQLFGVGYLWLVTGCVSDSTRVELRRIGDQVGESFTVYHHWPATCIPPIIGWLSWNLWMVHVLTHSQLERVMSWQGGVVARDHPWQLQRTRILFVNRRRRLRNVREERGGSGATQRNLCEEFGPANRMVHHSRPRMELGTGCATGVFSLAQREVSSVVPPVLVSGTRKKTFYSWNCHQMMLLPTPNNHF